MSSLLFSGVFSNVTSHAKNVPYGIRSDILLYMVLVCPQSRYSNSFLHVQFSQQTVLHTVQIKEKSNAQQPLTTFSTLMEL